jgi:hypothetical protein
MQHQSILKNTLFFVNVSVFTLWQIQTLGPSPQSVQAVIVWRRWNWANRMVQVIESLPSKREALSSNLSTATTKNGQDELNPED